MVLHTIIIYGLVDIHMLEDELRCPVFLLTVLIRSGQLLLSDRLRFPVLACCGLRFEGDGGCSLAPNEEVDLCGCIHHVVPVQRRAIRGAVVQLGF